MAGFEFPSKILVLSPSIYAISEFCKIMDRGNVVIFLE